MIELLTEYFLHNQDKLKTLGLTSGGIILIKETIRTMIKKQQKSNNKGLLSIVRKLSSYFRTHEASNMYHINISHWFDLISMIRHTLVHNRQIISNPLLKYLEKNKANLMFSEHFQMKKIGGNICIYLEQSKAYEIILRLNAFAYFIFKGLSIEARLSFETPDYIPQAWDESPFSW